MRDILDALGDERKASNVISNVVTGVVVPSGLRSVAMAVDPTMRKPEGLIENVKTAIPFLSKTVPAKLSAFNDLFTNQKVLQLKYLLKNLNNNNK